MDFPSGYNIVSGARAYEPIGFEDLRALAETYDLLRLVIETRKDQVERMSWSLRPRRGATGPGSARINQLTRFFERPDGQHCFAIWLRMLLEDLFVIDAPTLWRQRARGGELVALHPLDGATIKRVIDDWGRTPQPFQDNGALIYPVAYQQILKGYPAVDYAARDIIYAPRNPRANRVYGFSPVEQIVMTANIALKRQMFTLSHFTEGNIPESLIGVPESWTPDQIKNFQDYWDAYFTGDLAARRRAKFVPGGVAKTFIQTKEPELKGVFDEWLARIVCYAFSVSHQAFVNQTNRSTGETQKEMAEEEGLWPVLKWVKRLIDGVLIEDFGEEDIEFAWGEDAQIDAGQQAQVLTSYVGAGILTRNEARVKLGEAPVADPAANVLTVTGAAPTPVGQGSGELAKNYNPEQPRDWHGRFGEGSGEAKAKPKSGGVQTADASANALLPMIGLGLLGAAIVGHAASNSARKKPESGSRTPVSPSTSDKPEEDGKPDREPRFRGDNLGPELGKPGALPPDDPRQPAVAPLAPTKDESNERPTKEGGESSSPADNASAPKAVEGALPNAENAVIDPKKIYGYSLKADHAEGGPKAEAFKTLLGFDQSNGDELIAQIRKGVLDNAANEGVTDEHGKRFDVDIPVTGPNGNTETVRTGWIFDPGSTAPRLSTAFIRSRRKIKKARRISYPGKQNAVKSGGAADAGVQLDDAPTLTRSGESLKSMLFSEFDRVVLAVDLPDRGLLAGTEGVVIDVHTTPSLGYEVEFFDEDGDTIDWGPVAPAQLRPYAKPAESKST